MWSMGHRRIIHSRLAESREWDSIEETRERSIEAKIKKKTRNRESEEGREKQTKLRERELRKKNRFLRALYYDLEKKASLGNLVTSIHPKQSNDKDSKRRPRSAFRIQRPKRDFGASKWREKSDSWWPRRRRQKNKQKEEAMLL